MESCLSVINRRFFARRRSRPRSVRISRHRGRFLPIYEIGAQDNVKIRLGINLGRREGTAGPLDRPEKGSTCIAQGVGATFGDGHEAEFGKGRCPSGKRRTTVLFCIGASSGISSVEPSVRAIIRMILLITNFRDGTKPDMRRIWWWAVLLLVIGSLPVGPAVAGPFLALSAPEAAMQIYSSAFASGGTIPRQYTCEGEDLSPPLRWEDIPVGTQSLVLIVEDPDAPDPEAPQRIWVHWILYDIPPLLMV